MKSLTNHFALGLATAYLVLALVTSLPEQFPLRPVAMKLSDPIFRFTGLWQGWAMFAPNPISEDIYVSSKATFTDGSQITWELSHMNQMSLTQRYQMERWRKWANDNLRLDANKPLWQDAARWVAGEMERSYGKRVESIELIRHWQGAVVPDSNGYVARRGDWSKATFYTSKLAH